MRSNFEHYSTIWRPVNIVDLCKFEALQKRAIKWINSEEANRYSDEIYAIRCREANILPLQLHFELNGLVFFYKIVYDLIPVSLPAYISPYNGESRLKSTRMDEMSYFVNDNTVIPLILLIATANFSNLSFTELCTVGILYLLTIVKVTHSSNLNWKSKTSYGINYCRINL